MFVFALAGAVAAEPLLEVSGAAVGSAMVETLEMGSPDPAGLLRSAPNVERRPAKAKTHISHRHAICGARSRGHRKHRKQGIYGSSPLTGGMAVLGVTAVEMLGPPVLMADAERDVVFGPSMTVELLGPTPKEKKEPAIEGETKTKSILLWGNVNIAINPKPLSVLI